MRASVLLIALVVAVASVFALSEDVRADGSRYYGKVAVVVDDFYLSFGTARYGHPYPHYRHKVIHYHPHRYCYKPYHRHYMHYRHFDTHPYRHHPKPYYRKYQGDHYRKGQGYYRPHKYSGKHYRTTGYGSRHGGERHRR